ncbi:MAG: Na+/H+ antiporter subunit B [Phycisphaerales bacterium]
MNSIILQVAARLLLPVMILLSIVFLLRGHNEPGGGFVGGLLAAAGFILYAFAVSLSEARRLLVFHPRTLIGWGLIFAVISGIPAVFAGYPFLKGLWIEIENLIGFEQGIKVGTPFIFDVGVYLVVIGVTLLMAFTLEERQR